MDARSDDEEPLIEFDHLSKWFDTSQGVTDRLFGREPEPVQAVNDVSLSIDRGDVMGIAGESGCGKTTLGKLLVKLLEPTEGTIRFDGQDVTTLSKDQSGEFRQRVQMIFQDPFQSLNPRMTVFDSVAEPLRINDIGDSYQERRDRVVEVLDDVGLAPAEVYLDSFPRELSGGERQRVAIARALVVNPDFIVADEPVSMLDVSIRAGVLNLMKDLQDRYGLTYLFISHDLSLIRYMCDRTAIMYLGEVIEQGETDRIVTDPKHPYTEALFDAVPDIDSTAQRQRANVLGEVPSPRRPPSGCRFHPRCANIIPPEDWQGGQDAFRRAFHFKHRVLQGDLDVEDVAEHPDTASRDELVDELLGAGLSLDLPEEHRTVEDERGVADVAALDLPAATGRLLRQAAEDVADGDLESARARFDGQLQSVCERAAPELRPTDEQVTACHLYDSSAGRSVVAPDPSD